MFALYWHTQNNGKDVDLPIGWDRYSRPKVLKEGEDPCVFAHEVDVEHWQKYCSEYLGKQTLVVKTLTAAGKPKKSRAKKPS